MSSDRKARTAVYGKTYRDKNPQKERDRSAAYRAANAEKEATRKRRFRENNPNYFLFSGARARARRDGILFDISADDIVVPPFCPLLGIALAAGTNHAVANSPSLDRINPVLGYVKGNVWVISHKANAMKQDATFDQLRTFAVNVLNFINKYT